MSHKTVWNNSDGLRVGYGPNEPSQADVGVVKTFGNEREIEFDIVGSRFTAGAYVFEENLSIPAGFEAVASNVQVTEAFALGGTTPVINIGTSAVAALFGSVSEANAEAIGSYSLTVTAGVQAAAATIAVALGGTGPTVTSAGKAKVRVTIRRIAR